MSNANLDSINTLDELFSAWKEDVGYRSEAEKLKKQVFFVKDGVIDESKYYSGQKKILYILRDAHVCDDNPEQDLRAAFRESCQREGNTWNNVGRWTLALLDGLNSYADMKMNADILREQLCRTAVMNLKKASGGSFAENIKEFAQSQADYINKEIQLIDPDIIITCEGKLLRKVLKTAQVSENIPAREDQLAKRKDYPEAFFRYTVQLNGRNVNVVSLHHPRKGRYNQIMFDYICDMSVLLK